MFQSRFVSCVKQMLSSPVSLVRTSSQTSPFGQPTTSISPTREAFSEAPRPGSIATRLSKAISSALNIPSLREISIEQLEFARETIEENERVTKQKKQEFELIERRLSAEEDELRKRLQEIQQRKAAVAAQFAEQERERDTKVDLVVNSVIYSAEEAKQRIAENKRLALERERLIEERAQSLAEYSERQQLKELTRNEIREAIQNEKEYDEQIALLEAYKRAKRPRLARAIETAASLGSSAAAGLLEAPAEQRRKSLREYVSSTAEDLRRKFRPREPEPVEPPKQYCVRPYTLRPGETLSQVSSRDLGRSCNSRGPSLPGYKDFYSTRTECLEQCNKPE